MISIIFELVVFVLLDLFFIVREKVVESRMTIKKIIIMIMNCRRDHWYNSLNDDDYNNDCRIVPDMLFSVYYVCTLYRKTENISKILSSFFFYKNRFAELVRIISTHRHTRLLACFRFSTKKNREARKKKEKLWL